MAALLLSRRAHLLTTCKTGGGMPYGIVRSPRGISLSAESDRQCHITAVLLSSSAQTANSLRRAQRIGDRNSLPLLPPACANLPPAALTQRWTVRSHRPFSLLRKRNRKRKRVKRTMAIYHLEAKVVSRGAGACPG